jgi:hypothetical protein
MKLTLAIAVGLSMVILSVGLAWRIAHPQMIPPAFNFYPNVQSQPMNATEPHRP